MCHRQSATNEAGIKDRYNRTTEALVLLSVFVSFARFITFAFFEASILQPTLAVAFHDFNYTWVQILRDRSTNSRVSNERASRNIHKTCFILFPLDKYSISLDASFAHYKLLKSLVVYSDEENTRTFNYILFKIRDRC